VSLSTWILDSNCVYSSEPENALQRPPVIRLSTSVLFPGSVTLALLEKPGERDLDLGGLPGADAAGVVNWLATEECE
jgi:hypothetical protein